MDFSGKKNVDIFEKWIHFLILEIIFKNDTSQTFGGLSPPGPPAGALKIPVFAEQITV